MYFYLIMDKITELLYVDLKKFVPNYNNITSREISDYLFDEFEIRHVKGVQNDVVGAEKVNQLTIHSYEINNVLITRRVQENYVLSSKPSFNIESDELMLHSSSKQSIVDFMNDFKKYLFESD